MGRIILWFWYLALIWCVSFCVTTRLVFAAEPSKEVIDSERKLGSMITDFFLNSEEDKSGIPTSDLVTVIASRLPSFRTRLSDIPSNVSNIPANVSYKSKGELAHARARNVQDAVQDIEGGIFYDNAIGNGLDTVFSLRGFSEDSAVIVLVDGVRVNELDGDAVNFPLVPMHDIESMQIERGSASPIYGSGAFGGVVNITTRKPSEKLFGAFGGVELSSFKGIKFNQGVGGSIQDRLTPMGGKLTYYFNGGRDVNDGFRDNGEWRLTSFDVKTAYELPDDEGRIHAGVKHVQDALSNPSHITLSQFHADPEQTIKPLDGRDFKNTIIQMGADKKFWNKKIVTSILASWRVNLIHFYTTGIQFADFTTGSNPDTDLVTVKTRTADLVWQVGYEDRWWDWLGNRSEIGMEFRNASESALEQNAFGGEVPINAVRETERGSQPDQMAIFWRETISFFRKVIVHVGARHDWHQLKVQDHLNQSMSFTDRWHASTVSTGVTLKPIEYSDLFFNYSQGFRVPSISEIAPFSGTFSSNLEPEKSSSYEVGTRLRYKDLAQAKFSYFLIDVNDEIALDFTSITQLAPFGQNVNLGQTRRKGVETRLDLNPIPEFDAYGSFTWMEAYVREEGPVTSGGPVKGRGLGQVPQNRFTLGTTVRPFQRLGEPYDGFSISMTGIFTGKQHLSNFESAAQTNLDAGGHFIKPYTVWNTMISFEWKGKRIYFRINNLFNERYFSRAIAAQIFQTTVVPAGRYLFVTPGAPREYLLGATWEFA